jgi:tetratricopeptide (TPR) repeat protein
VVSARSAQAGTTTVTPEHLPDSNDAHPAYETGELYLHAGRPAEAAAHFKAHLRTPQRLSPEQRTEAYASWLQALIALGQTRDIDRVARRAEAAAALSPAARELLAVHNERRGRLTEARRQRTLALEDLATALETLPEEQHFGVALLATHVAAQIEPGIAGPWLVRALTSAPDDLDGQLALLEVRLANPVLIEVDEDAVNLLDRALVDQDWQATYDIGMRMPLGTTAALARVLHLSACLRGRGAAGAALDLLSRAFDAHPNTEAVSWQLISVLIDLERYEDAQAAIALVQLLRGGTPQQQLAV